MPNFGVNFWDGENERGFDFFLTKHQQMVLRIALGNHMGPATSSGSQTLNRTFFWAKNLCAQICINCEILHAHTKSHYFFYFCNHPNIIARWYQMHTYLFGCKFWLPNSRWNIIGKQTVWNHVLILHKINLFSTLFRKFSKDAILGVDPIPLRIHSCMQHTCNASKSC